MIETTNNNNDNHKVPLTNEYNVSLSLIINSLISLLLFLGNKFRNPFDTLSKSYNT